MQDIMTVKDLIEDLSQRDPNAPVMVAVIKYPGEFAVQFKEDGPTWVERSDVELVPITFDDVIHLDEGIIYIAAELEEFNEERWMVGGNRTD